MKRVALLALAASVGCVPSAAPLKGVPAPDRALPSLSLAAGHLLRSFLFGVTAYDVLTLLGAGAALAAVALLAALTPARRACRIDPVMALRYQ